MSNSVPSPPFSKSRTYPSLSFPPAPHDDMRAKLGNELVDAVLDPLVALALLLPVAPQRCGLSIAMPCTAALLVVVMAAPTAPTVRGTMVTGSRSTSVKEASTVRFTWAGLCEPRKRAVSVFGEAFATARCSES